MLTFNEIKERNAGLLPQDEEDRVAKQAQEGTVVPRVNMEGLYAALGQKVDTTPPTVQWLDKATLSETMSRAGMELAGIAEALDNLPNDNEQAKTMRFRARELQSFLKSTNDPDRFGDMEQGAAGWGLLPPEGKGNFLDGIMNSWARTTVAVKQLFEAKNIPVTEGADISAAAFGWTPMPEDPVKRWLVAEARGRLERTHPFIYKSVQEGIQYGEEHPIKAFGAEIVAFLPLAIIEGVATHGAISAAGLTAGRIVAAETGINMAIGAMEGYAFTPGPQENRLLVGGISGVAGGALTVGIHAVGRALGKGAAGAVEAGQKALPAAAEPKALLPATPERIQLSRLLRQADELLTTEDEAAAGEVVRAVNDGIVDSQDLINVWDRDGNLGSMVGYVRVARKELLEQSVGDYLPVARARARARARETARSMHDKYTSSKGSLGAGEQARLLREASQLDMTAGMIDALRAGPGTPEFRSALDEYAMRVSSDVTERTSAMAQEVEKKFPGIEAEELTHMADRWHAFMFEGRVRGVDVDLDINVVGEAIEAAGDIWNRSHPDVPIGTAAAGKVEGTVGRAGFRRQAVQGEGLKRPPGVRKKVQSPAFVRMAISLFADPRPGRTALRNVHELSHVYMTMLQQASPEKFTRLAQEVGEHYSKYMNVARVEGLEFDPVRAGELFAELLTNYTALSDTATSGLLEGFQKRFGEWVSRLLSQINEWRSKYWKTGGQVNVRGNTFSTGRAWSPELAQVADQFSRQEWGGLFDDLKVEKYLPRGRRTTAVKAFEALPVEEADELLEPVIGRLKRVEVLIETLKRSRKRDLTDVEVAQAADLEKEAGSLRAAVKRVRSDRGKELYGSARRKPRDQYGLVEIQGLAEPVRVRPDVRAPVLAGISNLNWSKVMRAMLSNAEVTEGGKKFPAWERVREMASWYERGNDGAKKLARNFRKIGRELLDEKVITKAEYNAMRAVTSNEFLSHLGMQGAKRGPAVNLGRAVRSAAYLTQMPTGHYTKAMDLGGAMRASIARRFGSYADAPALDALGMMADWNSTAAKNVLGRSGERGFPEVGETMMDWLRRTDMTEMDGALKLPSYEKNLLLDPNYVTNDIWQFRLFLWNDPRRIGAIYGLSSDNADAYLRVMKQVNDDVAAAGKSSRNITSEIQTLTDELGKVPGGSVKAKTLQTKIGDLEAVRAKTSEEGSRIWNSEKQKWQAFTSPKNGEYLLMEDVQFQLAEMLNRVDPRGDNFWNGHRVQAALWGLTRGKALGDEAQLVDFGRLTEDAMKDGKFKTWVVEAVTDGKRDRMNDRYFFTAQEAVVPWGGETHALNKFHRAAAFTWGEAKKSFDEQAKATAALSTSSKGFTKSVALRLKGTKKTTVTAARGEYKGDANFAAFVTTQAPADDAARLGFAHSALNLQETTILTELGSWADDEARGILSRVTFRGKNASSTMDKQGFRFRFAAAKSLETATQAWNQFKTLVAERAGKQVDEVFSGATTFMDGPSGQSFVANGDGFGILDMQAFIRHAPRALREVGGEVRAWTGETIYVDVTEELAGAADALGQAYRSEVQTLERVSLAGDARAIRAGNRRIGSLAGGYWLGQTLQELDKEAQLGLLGDLALAWRTRAASARALLDAATPEARARGAALTIEDVVDLEAMAAGEVPRLLREIDPDAISEEMIDQAFGAVDMWRGKSRLPTQHPLIPGKKKGPTINPRGALNAADNRLGKDINLTAFDELSAEDLAEIAAMKADEAGARAQAVGNQVEAERAARVADMSRATGRVASVLDDDATLMDAVLAGDATGGGSAELTRGARGMFNHATQGIRHFWRAQTKNLFEAVNRLSPTVSNLFNVALAADVEARWVARRATQYVMKDLLPAERELVERFLQSEKATIALERAAGDESKIGEGMRQLIMAPGERQAALNNKAVAGALKRHKERSQPLMESFYSAVNEENADHLLVSEDGFFMPSMAYDPAVHTKGVRTLPVGDSVGTKFDLGTQTVHAKGFKGSGKAYVTDYEELLRWKINRENALARQRQLLGRLEREGMAIPVIPGVGRPDNLANGKQVTWSRVKVSNLPQWIKNADATEGVSRKPMRTRFEEYWMPREVQRSWDYMTTRGQDALRFGYNPRTGKANGLFKAADVITGAMLATVAEATRHSLRVLAMLARIPEVAGSMTPVDLVRLAPYIGVRARRVFQMMNVYNSPDAILLEGWMARINALPSRAFEEVEDLLAPGASGALNKIKSTMHNGRGYLFDLPDVEARGWKRAADGKTQRLLGIVPVPARLWGFDVRARVLATKIFIDHLEATGKLPKGFDLASLSKNSNEFDAPLREFLTQFGMFNGNIQTELVQWARRNRLNPFAGAQGGFRPAEMETLFGLDRLPKEGMSAKMRAWYAAQVLYGGWLGYMGMLTMANKALSGKWPWENQNGRELDLDLGIRDKNGAPVYLAGNLLEPAFTRAARTSGIKYVFDERFGYTVKDRFLRGATGGAINEVLGFAAAGPPVQTASIAMTGRAPYLLGGEMMRVAPPRADAGKQIIQNIWTAAINVNQNVAQLNEMFRHDIEGKQHGQDWRIKAGFEMSHVFLGKIGSVGKPPIVAQGDLARSVKRRRRDVVNSFVRRYQTETTAEGRREVFQQLASEFDNPRERALAINEFMRAQAALPRSAIRGAADSALIRRTQ